MTALVTKLRKYSFDYHKIIAWVGGIALLFFAISASMHLLMTWTGPQAVRFMPPATLITAEMTAKIPEILKNANLKNPILVKITPSATEPLLQVTLAEKKPREYYSLKTGVKIKNGDEEQARFLAAYYSGLPAERIKKLTFQTEFDGAYDPINRLIPVYKVTFDTEDRLTYYIHTELNAIASVNNQYKNTIQNIFRIFHTFSFLDGTGSGRVIVMSLLLFSIIGMCVTGFMMIFTVKKRKITDKTRYVHRLIANIIWFPLFAFAVSGLWHLLHYEYVDSVRGLRLAEPMKISPEKLTALSLPGDLPGEMKDIKLNAVNLLEYQNAFYYRLSVAASEPTGGVTRNKRFDGLLTEAAPVYLNAYTGERATLTDQALTKAYAENYLGTKIVNNEIVTHFGPHYDFRNKRLPVYEAVADHPAGDRVFIDPQTGMLVDQLPNAARYEGYSFSFLHKWNMLAPLIGREKRDALIAAFLFLTLGLTICGYAMLFARSVRRRKQ